MLNYNFAFFISDVDDEGIERDSDDVEDFKCRHTKDLDHILEVSNFLVIYSVKFEDLFSLSQ